MSLSKILVYLQNNVILLLFQVKKNTESKNPKAARQKTQ